MSFVKQTNIIPVVCTGMSIMSECDSESIKMSLTLGRRFSNVKAPFKGLPYAVNSVTEDHQVQPQPESEEDRIIITHK